MVTPETASADESDAFKRFGQTASVFLSDAILGTRCGVALM